MLQSSKREGNQQEVDFWAQIKMLLSDLFHCPESVLERRLSFNVCDFSELIHLQIAEEHNKKDTEADEAAPESKEEEANLHIRDSNLPTFHCVTHHPR